MQALSTRLDDKGRDRTVLVMQRLHPRDLTGVCVDLGFEQLSLPALAPRRTTVVFPRSGDRVVREIDDPLWPERENTAQLALQRRTLGSHAFAAHINKSRCC
jgi:hypothetical protein